MRIKKNTKFRKETCILIQIKVICSKTMGGVVKVDINEVDTKIELKVDTF